MFWLIGTVFAQDLRIDTEQFEELKRSGFESHETGWLGLDRNWIRRIYVGDSPESVSIWLDIMREQYYKETFEPYTMYTRYKVDEVYGNKDFIMVRANTLGLICQGTNAEQCIRDLLLRQSAYHKPCSKPKLIMNQHTLLESVEVPAHCSFSFNGGTPTYTSNGIAFQKLPDSIIVYNQWAESWKYDLQPNDQYILSGSDIPQPPKGYPLETP